MKPFADYDKTQTYGDYERLSLGGHICKILEVKTEQFSTKEGKPFEQLIFKIDIADPDPQAGYYQRKFAEDARLDALKAKWKGTYRLTVPEDSSEDYTKRTFKTFITSIEDSNPGYKWNWEEQQLVGKVFGGVFGIEEFMSESGNIIPFTRCRFVRGIENIKDVEIPKVRLADKSNIDYEEYLQRKQAEKNGNTVQNNTSSSDEFSKFDGGDDLPF